MNEDGEQDMGPQPAQALPERGGTTWWLPERALTVDDLDLLPDDHRRFELIDGSLIVVPPALGRHERVVNDLLDLIRPVAPPDCRVVGAGVGIRSRKDRLLVPDGSLIRRSALTWDTTYLAPEDVRLVVEVVSPSNPNHDLVLKRALYAEDGIEHYWIVDSRGEGSLIVLRLHEGRYVEVPPDADGSVTVTDPVKLTLRPSDLIPD